MKRNKQIAMLMLILIVIWVGYVMVVSPSRAQQVEEGVLRVWTTWGDDTIQLQSLMDRYTQESGNPVQVTMGLKSKKITKALKSPNPPDVIILSSSTMVKYYDQQGWVDPLDPWMEASRIDLEDFYDAPLAQCEQQDGTFRCLPWGCDTFALFWNKDLFEEAGLDPDKPPQTMEELADFARKLTIYDDQGDLIQMGFLPDYPVSHTGLYAQMFGGSWLNLDGTEITVNSQPIIQAVNWQRQFYDLYGNQEVKKFALSINAYMNSGHSVYAGERLDCQQCHRNTPRNGEKIPDQGFYTGKIAMMVSGEWQLGSNHIQNYQPDLNYGVAPFPPPVDHPERAGTSIVSGPVVIIPAGALDKESAAGLLAWMMSGEVVSELTISNASLPTSRTAAQDLRFHQIPNFQVFLDLLDHPNAKLVSSTPVSEALNQALSEIEKSVLHKGADPLALLDEIQAAFSED